MSIEKEMKTVIDNHKEVKEKVDALIRRVQEKEINEVMYR